MISPYIMLVMVLKNVFKGFKRGIIIFKYAINTNTAWHACVPNSLLFYSHDNMQLILAKGTDYIHV